MAFVTIKDKDNVTLGYLQTDAQERLGVHNLLHVQDRKPSGAAGGDFASGAWRTRSLNTVVLNNIANASLVSNQLALPTGRYVVDASSPVYMVDSHQIRVISLSGTSIELYGTSERVNGTNGYTQTRSSIFYTFELSETTVLELQHRCQTTQTNGFGFGITWTGFGYNVYSDLKIWKLS